MVVRIGNVRKKTNSVHALINEKFYSDVLEKGRVRLEKKLGTKVGVMQFTEIVAKGNGKIIFNVPKQGLTNRRVRKRR